MTKQEEKAFDVVCGMPRRKLPGKRDAEGGLGGAARAMFVSGHSCLAILSRHAPYEISETHV